MDYDRLRWTKTFMVGFSAVLLRPVMNLHDSIMFIVVLSCFDHDARHLIWFPGVLWCFIVFQTFNGRNGQ